MAVPIIAAGIGALGSVVGGMMSSSGGSSSSASPSQTPAESMAYNEAQPYLAESNSGQLSAPETAAINQQVGAETGAELQDFAGSGVVTSGEGQLFGTVSQNGGKGMLPGSGSDLDLGRLDMVQKQLQQDTNTGLQYLAMSSGQAAALAGVQQAYATGMANSLAQAAASFGDVLGPGATPTSTDLSLDPSTPYSGPGAMGSDDFGAELVDDAEGGAF